MVQRTKRLEMVFWKDDDYNPGQLRPVGEGADKRQRTKDAQSITIRDLLERRKEQRQ
jgi:hypothetical protein